jgi:hypothetical protein
MSRKSHTKASQAGGKFKAAFCVFGLVPCFSLFIAWDWVRLILRPLFGLLYQPRKMDNDECGPANGIIGRETQSTRRKYVTVPFFPPQIPCNLTWAKTRAVAIWSRQLTAWDTARPLFLTCFTFRFWSKRYVPPKRLVISELHYFINTEKRALPSWIYSQSLC